jgi:hypothetical protein
MKHQILVHSLTRSSYATAPTDLHPEYHRVNERPETIPFTYRIIIYYFTNRSFIQNIAGLVKDQILVHSLTGSSYATSPTDRSSRMIQGE